jgi:hypothetical protein
MIILCEPQCKGFEHSDVNAALLCNILKKYESAVFIGERTHILFLKDSLLLSDLDKIIFVETEIPDNALPDIYKFSGDFFLSKFVFSVAKSYKSSQVFFTSITSTGLQAVKILSFFNSKFNVNVILHGNLEGITLCSSYRPWVYFFWIKNSLKYFNNNKLKIIVLGDHIKENLKKLHPELDRYIFSLNMPYFFRNFEIKVPKNNNLVFGFLGVVSEKKGGYTYLRLVNEITKNKLLKCEFRLIGQITDPNIDSKDLSYFKNRPSNLFAPMKLDTFITEVNSIDYSIFCFTKESYQLSCSATFYDALSFVKPIIALKTPFFEYYFKKLGDIGYLCENAEELYKCTISLTTNFDVERYKLQCQNILSAREILGEQQTSEQLQTILI